MEQNLKKVVRQLVKEEMTNMLPVQHDHEAKMAKGELRDMITLGAELYSMIQDGDNLPGWAAAYITLASDYIHSVHQHFTENYSE